MKNEIIDENTKDNDSKINSNNKTSINNDNENVIEIKKNSNQEKRQPQ